MKKLREKLVEQYKYKTMISFVFIFYLTMGISKYAQILFFQQNKGLSNYSFSYSAMAVAGAFSFLISNRVSSWNLRKILIVFLPVYSFGMFLRVIPNSSVIAIISGAISGIGASVTLLVIRSWIYSLTDIYPESKNLLVSTRYTIMQIATLSATLLAGGIISLLNSSNAIYIILIILSSLFMWSLASTKNIPLGRIQKKKSGLFAALPKSKVSGIFLFAIVLLLGLTDALIDPIVPAILRENGLSVSLTSFWVTVLGTLTVLASLVYQQSRLSRHSEFSFLFNELIVGIFMILAGVIYEERVYLLIIAFAIMSVGIAGFFIFKELMEYDMFPKEESFIYLGIAQSGFLVGDALGAPVGTIIFQHGGTQILLFLFGLLSIVCGFSYYFFYQVMKKGV
ncbi:MFS transporter [Pediococcus pentosaceus]|uniref:MFS transporter n=1 Tax=Pediococcus pentosaceus TaxID=1255 RepID=UPI0023B177EC|nr:MFS transporter [Pediococcus pentosaceus]MDE7512346.1 MFS transporter [Pediococcus pentosaceus]